MFEITSIGAEPLTPLSAPDGGSAVSAHVADATLAKNRLVQLNLKIINDQLQWRATATFASGGRFDIVGVSLESGKKDDVVPCLIYGPVKGVTLPASVTRTASNTELVRGGTRTNVGAGFAANPPAAAGTGVQADLAVASLTGANGANVKQDLWLNGRDFMRLLLFRSTGRYGAFKDNVQSQSLLGDDKGRFFLRVRAETGSVITKGALTILRRGFDGTWQAKSSFNAVADSIFCYCVPTESLAANSGKTARVQVVGWVNADLQASVNVTGQNGGIRYTPGSATLTPVTDYDDYRAFAIPEKTGNLRTRKIALMGKVFYA